MIYFNHSQLLLAKSNEHRSTSQKSIYRNKTVTRPVFFKKYAKNVSIHTSGDSKQTLGFSIFTIGTDADQTFPPLVQKGHFLGNCS